MNKIKSWIIAAILILSIQCAYSQKSDYIATDSLLTYGIKLMEGTAKDNAQFVRLKSKNGEIRYSAEQLTEYGFKNGTVYLSKSISVSGQIKKVFLERLEHGKISLYYFTAKGIKTYFLEKDSTIFVEISKDDFRKHILENTSDFEWEAEQVQLVKYNRKSLSKIISMYNNGNNRPFPYPRFGIIAGYSRTSLGVSTSVSSEHLNGISFTPSSSALFGVFADLPIEKSYFSLNTGVNVTKSGFSVNSSTPQSTIDVVVNTTSVNVPVLLRYTLPTLGWRPFIDAGGSYLYHLTNKGKIYESSIDQTTVTIDEVQQETLISRSMVGYSLGIGLQRNLDFRRIAAGELRFNQFPGNDITFQKTQLEILVSFSF
ncbi:outer membrane beta-barrel protein [Pontibacter sp. 172403-2]|uniref:outer membrane beta-barrel protein n=1 Tax=Pontibacter rufus TaxID=2791028 RepID=UPI0018AF9915|nr:outer membrane beta-barrel protein [Pontibacter sp. 172403-2]MBF9255749.1 outer membrane beta-barrel protein [Pontibacter sp. 172403-2]